MPGERGECACCAHRHPPPERTCHPSQVLGCFCAATRQRGVWKIRENSKPRPRKTVPFLRGRLEDAGARWKGQRLLLPFQACQTKGLCLAKSLPGLEAGHHDHAPFSNAKMPSPIPTLFFNCMCVWVHPCTSGGQRTISGGHSLGAIYLSTGSSNMPGAGDY